MTRGLYERLRAEVLALKRQVATLITTGAGGGGTPSAHASSHQNGGTDEVNVAGLSGELADPQPPKAHKTNHQSGGSDAIQLDNLAAPDDNTDLNASTSAHGLMQKYPGGTVTFLRADGSFAAPSLSTTFSGALARKSVDQTAADYTVGANVTWDAEDYDVGGWHDTGANTDLMTVPSGVTYVRAYAELRLASVTTDVHILIEFRKNGSATPAYGAQRSEVGSANPTLSIASPPIPVNAGDSIAVFLLIETDTSVTVTADRSYLAIERVA
jgi:hypothetical protein